MRMPENKRPHRPYYFIAFTVLLIAVFFLLSSLYFRTHFYPGTVINGVGTAWLTEEEADRRLANRAAVYTLVLKERGNVNEQITGSEIELKLNPLHGGSACKDRQNRTFWIVSLLQHDSLRFERAFTCDESLLRDRYDKLICRDATKIIEPKNASLTYESGGYRIIEEVYGNQLNGEMLYSKIKAAVENGSAEMDLEKMNCYIDPTIRSDSPKIKNTKKVAEGYIASKIIYPHAGGSEIVDESEISSWIEFDDDLNISFNEKKIGSFLYQLAANYDTCGKERDFTTSLGNTIQVGGGDYGWKVDIKKEKKILIDAVMRGGTTVREPEYSQRGVRHDSNDIGSTYVEINLTKQHLWYYDTGVLVAHGAVVTGDINGGHRTPEGIYSLKYKIRNAVLKGTNYRTNVSYWMPFNNDIGIHDAPWRTEFGRDIYLTRGSHGCVNVAFRLAETLFNKVEVGTPIVCYY